jgi:hypothetical protein
MTALELMAACRRDNQEKARLEARVEELDDAITCISAFGGAGGRGSVSDRFAAYSARKDELERRLKQVKRALAAEIAACILLSDALPDTQRRAMRGFYCYGKSVSILSEEMHYTPRNVYKALAAGREAAEKISGETVLDKLPPWYLKRYRDGDGKEWEA